MSYKPGDIFYSQFTVNNISGILSNTDTTPWSTMVKNGVDDLSATPIYVSNIDIGRYLVSGKIPNTYSAGMTVGLIISGYVNSTLAKNYINIGCLDSLRVGDLTTTPLTIASGGIDNIMIENNVNMRQWASAIGSAIAGSSVVNSNNITYYALNNNNITRIVSTAVSGSRQSIVITLPN